MGWRVLCLGNELLADDAFGKIVADRVRLFAEDVVFTPESGLYLLEHVVGTDHLLVVDSIVTGTHLPGHLHTFEEDEIACPPGTSPHYVGLFETLRLARSLGLEVPSTIRLLAVEARDCLTVGGPMDPAVADAVPIAVDRIRTILDGT